MGTRSSVGSRQIGELSELMLARVPELAERITDQICEIYGYQEFAAKARDGIYEACVGNITFVLRRLLGSESADLSPARRTGRDRALAGIPLESVMTAYRIGFRQLWQEIVVVARETGVPAEAMLDASVDIFWLQDEFTQAMSDSYTQQLTIQIIDQEEERSALVEAVLFGRIAGQGNLWKAADILRLPASGPYVVVAAQIPGIGKLGLAEIASKLAAHDIHSAWRLGPDLQVGIVHLGNGVQRYSTLTELLDREAAAPVGISPQFNNLTDAGTGLRLARIAVTCRPTGEGWIRAFVDAPLSAAAVSSPEVMEQIESEVLNHINALPAKHRAVLVETFHAWLDSGGSANDAADTIFCHPNTVRHRLRRIEELTGRSLSHPRQVAELCLAFEIERQRAE